MILESDENIWDGWFFDGNRLISPQGNRYTKQAIEVCFFLKQLPEASKLLIHPGCKGCPKAN
jgi:hypothetical protein